MSNNEYKWGIYFNKFASTGAKSIGWGFYYHKPEVYIHFELWRFELAIGKTTKS